jgi:hypothetical protein
MTVYKTRRGVVLTEICGEYVLIAAKALLDRCPYLTQINESSAFLWKRMMNGATLEELVIAVEDEYEILDVDETKTAIDNIIKNMMEMNYLESMEAGEKNELYSEE